MNDTTHGDEREHDGPEWPGFTRRAFIQSFGAGTVTLAVSRNALGAAGQAEKIPAVGEAVRVTLDVNGRAHQLLVEPRWTLLYVLRERLGLTAAKIGCERGECGSCTVLIDDLPRYACLTLAVEAEGRRIETAEGLMDGERLGQVQTSFVREDGLQCGYCTPGQIVAAEGLLRRNPSPSFEEIRTGMSGNLCRCGAYAHIFNAVADAAKRRKG
ncbi:MAG: (2Fe-2S)-binding protein [Gammaproteobacteria bacterium]|jgi:xanthine dehydrogenase YagT iron-sulfur-binding subunit